MKEMANLPEYELEICKSVVSEYLKYGSVDELLKANNYDIPMSQASIHRLIDEWGIVKAAGPNKPLSELIGFFVSLAEKQVPLETLYKKMPSSFTHAVASLHRTYKDIKKNAKEALEERDLRRVGTAVMIYSEGNPNEIMIGLDTSPRVELGKPYGAVSVPMGFSKRNENPQDSIRRLLQQEVFMEKTVERKFPDNVIPMNPEPFMYVDVVDVRVAVYVLSLPSHLSDLKNFTSHRLKKHRFLPVNEASKFSANHNFRAGLKEMFETYQDLVHAKQEDRGYQIHIRRSWINRKLEEAILAAQARPEAAV